MSTTSLYVELVVIGIQVLAWVALLFDSIKIGLMKNIVNSTNSTLIIFATVVSAYILGIIFDRLADVLFSKSETKIRNASGLQAENSLLVEGNSKSHEFQLYTKSKHRILRAASLNIPLITIAGLIHMIAYHRFQIPLAAVILLTGGLLTVLSFWSTRLTLESFYNKTRLLEIYCNHKTRADESSNSKIG